MAELSNIPARELALVPGKTMSQFSMVITGDMSFGENYQAREEGRGRENILKTRGYAYTMEKIAPLLRNSDLVLSNLETVVTDHEVSPFAQTKSYIHWSDIHETPKQLLAHNIRLVSLANNHAIDFGHVGLTQTLQVLSDAGIAAFGAGRNLNEARQPFNRVVTLIAPSGETKQVHIRVHAAFAVDDKYRNKFKAYAESSRPGTNPLLLEELSEEISLTKTTHPNCFVIAVLHWRRDYRWRSARQVEAAQKLLRAGADLLIGHGSHMMQEIEKIDGRWVVHGLGNFVFNSPGRYRDMKVPPYSLAARLIFEADLLAPRLLLYPLLTDNRITAYQTRFTTDSEFKDIIRILRERTTETESFDREINPGKDAFGNFIDVPVKPQQKAMTSKVSISSSIEPKPAAFAATTTHLFKGANIHISRPAVRFAVDFANFETLPSQDAAQFLLNVLPDLAKALPAARPLTTERVGDWLRRASLTEIAAVVTFTLMLRVDEKISEVITEQPDKAVGSCIICEYKRSPENAKAAAALAVQILQMAIDGTARSAQVDRQLAEFEKIGKRRGRLPLNTVHILEEAEVRGIPINNSVAGPTKLGHGRFQKRIRQAMTSNTGFLAVRMARDKDQTLTILREAGIPVPEHYTVENATDAITAAEAIGYPIVVKPAGGNMGRGVSVKLASSSQVAEAFDEAIKIGKPVIVERYISGSDHRLLVVNGELVAACQRVPGHVVGNGLDSIRRLLDKLNADPRRDNHFMHKIEIDFDAERMLAEQGLKLDSVPHLGQVVFLRSKANFSAGGTNKGLTDLVHPDNRRMAIAAARAVNLDIAGVDFITLDIRRSYKETGGAICEINNSPGIDFHALPSEGTSVNVASYIVDMLFPDRTNGRIPTIVVCGGRGAEQVAQATSQLLQMSGHQMGLATQQGIWIAGDRVSTGDFANPTGAQRVLWNPAVDAAVMQISTQSVLEQGLGYDHCDVLVVTDLPEDITDEAQSSAAITTAITSSRVAVIFGTKQRIPAALVKAARDRCRYASALRLDTEFDGRFELNGRTLDITAGQTCETFTLPPATWLPASELAIAVAACHAIGIDADLINDALKTINVDGSSNLLLNRIDSPIGPVLLATPRSLQELRSICATARSWAAPQKPDIYVQISFAADSELLSAITSEIKEGFATGFKSGKRAQARHLSDFPFISKDPADKLLILTDNMEFFRKLLTQMPKAEHLRNPAW